MTELLLRQTRLREAHLIAARASLKYFLSLAVFAFFCLGALGCSSMPIKVVDNYYLFCCASCNTIPANYRKISYRENILFLINIRHFLTINGMLSQKAETCIYYLVYYFNITFINNSKCLTCLPNIKA